MSARGELFTFEAPLEQAAAALAGDYTVAPTPTPTPTPGGAGAASAIAVRDALDKLVCRITVRSVPGPSHWLTLAPLRGYAQDGERIRSLLLDRGSFRSEESWRSAAVPMHRGERADAAVVRVLSALLAIHDANLPGALADSDPEFLHDLRVAIRRTRSVLRQMRGVFLPERLEPVRGGLRWLQQQTGPTRDLDVYLQELAELQALAPETMRAGLAPLEPLLEARRQLARAAMVAALTSPGTQALQAQWAELLDAPAAGTDAERPVAALAARRIRRVHRAIVRAGGALTPATPPEAYHELRKQGKELRYLLELFGMALFDQEPVAALVRALKDLQDVLGRHQDRAVQAAMLREIGDELVAAPGGAAALMAIGTLVSRLEAEAADARGAFSQRFEAFASEAQCKLVSKLFANDTEETTDG